MRLRAYSEFFSSGAGLKPTVFVGAMRISAPVWGFRPTRPARFFKCIVQF
jgi:hypothetical protein